MSYINLDFKSGHAPPTTKKPRPVNRLPLRFVFRGLMLTAVIATGIYASIKLIPVGATESRDSTLKQQRLHYSVLLPHKTEDDLLLDTSVIIPPQVQIEQDDRWQSYEVKSGDTLASILDQAGLSPATTHEIATLNKQTKQLTRIKPGQTIAILKDENADFHRLKYMPSLTQTLLVKRVENGRLESEIQHHPLDPIPVFKSGVITSSLFLAAEKSGIPENIIMEMAGIFGWDIDFALDIREGDSFSIVYNELYKDGIRIRTGQILAAEFINQGKKFQAVYYTDPKGDSGYFSPDGNNMRKAFLRSPVKFSRISSRFTRKRWHPVLSKWRSHKGVDYAASRGTPVRASGDGKVTFAGNKGGYGKTIILQHGGKYTTLYAHLSRYAGGVRSGKRIKQGQIIGYVGSSGLATGPHLHYEFRLNGVHRNPLTVKLPDAEPINPSYLENFKKETRTYLSLLRLMDDQSIAQLDR